MPNVRVSSGEFLKAYGRISETALREPVSITNHGRERLVLLSADEYRRLKRNDRVALHPSELSEAEVHALETMNLPEEGREFDHEVGRP
jgi:PHD/YefM family antitoxin component YafN of YafNO toxin-antitoxin module